MKASVGLLVRWVGFLILAVASEGFADEPAAKNNLPAAAATAANDQAILMRSYIVGTVRIDKHPWRYASVPGIEILTRATDYETYWILHSVQRGLWVQNAVVPADCYAEHSVPFTLIIDDQDLSATSRGRLHSDPLSFKAAPDALAWGGINPRLGYGRIEARDDDTYSKNINIYHVDTGGMMTDLGWGLEQRLVRGAPPLPEWFIAGLVGRYGIFRESFLFVPGKTDQLDLRQGLGINVGGNNDAGLEQPIRKIIGPGTLWLSIDETARLRENLTRNPGTRVPLLPLSELFGPMPPGAKTQRLWGSEAGLFVRWALLGPGRETPALERAFLRFIQRARTEPVTEHVFADCYGFGFSTMEDKLEAFLKVALGSPTTVPAEFEKHPLDRSTPLLLRATEEQVARILGDWLRMEGNALRTENPALSGEFFNAAGRILRRTFRDENEAISDRALLGVFGLYENDMGNDVRARKLLEAAFKAEVVRPEAYLVLARLRYSATLAKTGGKDGSLTAQQVASIVAPLLKGRHQLPHNSDVYGMIADTWTRFEGQLSNGDLAVLEEGVSLFPQDAGLGYYSALAMARHGFTRQAAALVDKSLGFARTDPQLKGELENLRSRLSRP